MAKEIVCAQCGEAITERQDLVVAGKYLFSFHEACYPEARKKLVHKLSYRINGPTFWYLFIGLNLLLAGTCLAFPGSWQDVRWFFLITNVPLLLFRAMAWAGVERHLD